MAEVNICRERELSIYNLMRRYKFSEELITEIKSNWDNLKNDLEAEGVKFD